MKKERKLAQKENRHAPMQVAAMSELSTFCSEAQLGCRK